MRLAYLCADRGVPLDGTKGASVHVRAVSGALRARGHDVEMLVASPGAEPAASVGDIGFDRALKRTRKAIASDTGDPVLASEMHGLLLDAKAIEALEESHRSSPLDAVYERYSLWSRAGLRFAQRHGIPLVLEVNAPLVREQRAYRDLALPAVARQVAREVIRGASTVVVPAAELVRYVEDELGRRRRTVVLPNGIDRRLFESPTALGPGWRDTAGAFVVAFVGSLKPWHGIDVLLEGFRRLLERRDDVRLLIVGEGPCREQVEEAAASWGAERVRCTGAVPHRDVAGELARADVGVAPYPRLTDFYFSPLKVVEYMAAGLPVVASRIGQLESTVEPERTGLLVTPGDPAELAAALERLAADPDAARRMGDAGRAVALESYTWDAVAARIERLIERDRGRLARRASA